MLTKKAHKEVRRLASLMVSPYLSKFIIKAIQMSHDAKKTYSARQMHLLANNIITNHHNTQGNRKTKKRKQVTKPICNANEKVVPTNS